MAKTAHAVDLEPIDRLEDKVKRLITLLDRLRVEHARAAEDNQRLTRELDAAHERLAEAEARLADSEKRSGELSTLREERDVIRRRVVEMLDQLEALNL